MIRLYFDEESVDQALVRALRVRVDVSTALEENMIEREDEEHLTYAKQQDRVLFSFNRKEFYRLHTECLEQNKGHMGIILANQQQYSVGEQMRRILRLSAAKTGGEFKALLGKEQIARHCTESDPEEGLAYALGHRSILPHLSA